MKLPPILRFSLPSMCLAGLALSAPSASATLLFDMGFNNPDTSVTAVGSSVGSYTFNTFATNGTATAIQNGAGVSGQSGDYSLNLSSATRMGGSNTTASGPVAAYVANSGVAIGAQTSVTIAGWFQTATSTQVGGQARILEFSTLSVNGGSTDGTLTLNIDGVTLSSTAGYTTTQEWVFFAATFDGSIASGNNVSFYVGGLEDEVSLVSSGRINLAGWNGFSVPQTGSAIRLGNTATGSAARARPFDGYLDELQVYGGSGSTGALSLSELDAVRLSAVPEPGTWALVALGGVTIVFLRRRKQVQGS